MHFPGVAPSIEKYRALAPREQTDLLGNYIPPYAYAQMQVLEQALNRVGKVDQAALAADMHANAFDTIVGSVELRRHRANGRRSATSTSSSRTSRDGDLEKYKRAGTKVILASRASLQVRRAAARPTARRPERPAWTPISSCC